MKRALPIIALLLGGCTLDPVGPDLSRTAPVCYDEVVSQAVIMWKLVRGTPLTAVYRPDTLIVEAWVRYCPE